MKAERVTSFGLSLKFFIFLNSDLPSSIQMLHDTPPQFCPLHLQFFSFVYFIQMKSKLLSTVTWRQKYSLSNAAVYT